MGVRCSCGVLVNATKEDVNVKFNGVNGNERGTITYMANVCADTLATSTLSLTFTDTDGNPPDTSFDFTATAITSVTCRREGNTCVVTVTGTGSKTGFGGDATGLDFTAVFRDNQSPGVATDIVTSFDITGFFSQTGAEPVPNGTITALGCAEGI
ncbi:hypothetical protein [Peribacillus kribbensis]|uniref:hypothetical protein n=1 Tax=Peribacillus kribbensis TaxID=356658 RepID=UPI0004786BA4|nr:hypothetical protein [Peribacillus kribbensis]